MFNQICSQLVDIYKNVETWFVKNKCILIIDIGNCHLKAHQTKHMFNQICSQLVDIYKNVETCFCQNNCILIIEIGDCHLKARQARHMFNQICSQLVDIYKKKMKLVFVKTTAFLLLKLKTATWRHAKPDICLTKSVPNWLT